MAKRTIRELIEQELVGQAVAELDKKVDKIDSSFDAKLDKVETRLYKRWDKTDDSIIKQRKDIKSLEKDLDNINKTTEELKEEFEKEKDKDYVSASDVLSQIQKAKPKSNSSDKEDKQKSPLYTKMSGSKVERLKQGDPIADVLGKMYNFERLAMSEQEKKSKDQLKQLKQEQKKAEERQKALMKAFLATRTGGGGGSGDEKEDETSWGPILGGLGGLYGANKIAKMFERTPKGKAGKAGKGSRSGKPSMREKIGTKASRMMKGIVEQKGKNAKPLDKAQRMRESMSRKDMKSAKNKGYDWSKSRQRFVDNKGKMVGSEKVAKDIGFKPKAQPKAAPKSAKVGTAAKAGGKVLKGAGKALGVIGVGMAVYDGIKQTEALDKSSMSKKEYTTAVTGIWASIIAEYGVVTVVSMAAATIFGTAGSAVPIIGNLVGAVGGFVGGAAAGLAVDYYYGQEVETATKKFVIKVVDHYWDEKVDGKENKPTAEKETHKVRTDTHGDGHKEFYIGDRNKASTLAVGDSLASGILSSASGQKRGIAGNYADWPQKKPNESDAEYQKRLKKHMANNADVDAIPGRTPEQVLATLEKNKELYRGKNIILGTGLPNNQNQIAEVEKELKLLKDIGAKVTVLGAGNRPDFEKNKLNEKLATLAKKYGFKFTGPLADITTLSDDKVHVKDNEKLLKNIYGGDKSQPISQNKNPDVATGSKEVALSKVKTRVVNVQPVVMAQNTVVPGNSEHKVMMPASPIRNMDEGRLKAQRDSQRVV